MKPRTVIVCLIMLLLLVVTGVNWQLFSTPARLNLIAAQVEAPLGLGMLAVVALLTALYMLFLAHSEGRAMLEARKYRKDVEKYRTLAEAAEASRVKELSDVMRSELAAVRQAIQKLTGDSGTV